MPPTEFDEFCRVNHAFWKHASFPVSAPVGTVLIDLWHDNVHYLLRSLLIGRYVSTLRPMRLVGLLGRPGVVPQSCKGLDIEANKRLARSFGVVDFEECAPPDFDDHHQANELLDRLEPVGELGALTPARLRSSLVELLTEDEFPIGRFAYDTTLRSELLPTIDRIDARLRHWLSDCLALRKFTQRLCEGADDRAGTIFVTGHLDYDPWGLTGEVVRRMGGRILWFRFDHFVPTYLIGNDHGGSLNAAYHRIEADWFEATIWPLQEQLQSGVERFEAANASGLFHQRWTAFRTGELSPPLAREAARCWRRGYGWAEESVVVGVFAHALSDQPLADWQIFQDRRDWLLQTVAFAARHPERCWLIKLHPRDTDYDSTGTAEELIQRFSGLAHIRFVQAPVASGLIEGLCDIGVTIMGAPGLEMVSAGRPVVVAGNGPYAGCGFVHRADNEAHYRHLLLSRPEALCPTSEQVDRARLFRFTERVIGSASSRLLDPPGTEVNGFFWKSVGERIRHHTLADDDLHDVLRAMLGNDLPRSTNPRIGRHCDPDRSRVPQPLNRTLPMLQSEPLQFRFDGSGVPGLLKGFAPPEADGVWGTEDTLVIGFHVHPLAADESVELILSYRTLAARPGWPAQTVSIVSPASCLVREAVLEETGDVCLTLGADDVAQNGEVFLCLVAEHVFSPDQIGLSTDRRRLAVWLQSVAIR